MKKQLWPDEVHYGDSAYRPDMHGILIHGKRGRLLSVLYTAAGEGAHPAVILLHGIPGCERNLDLAQALRRAGFHVMTFHYSGSWGSDGSYSLMHNLEDAETVLDHILQDERYGFDKQHIYAVGHSLGGFVCGQLTAKRTEIKGAALLMPCDIGRLPQIAQNDPAAYGIIRNVLDESAGWLTDTSGETLLQEAFARSAEFALENLSEKLKSRPILCIGGTLDIYTPPQTHCKPFAQAIQRTGGVAFQKIDFPTDHFFADYRLTVAEAVTEFLKKQLSY